MATIDVKDAADLTVAIEKPLAPGRSAAATSRPVALSTEDKTALDLVSSNQTSQIAQEAAINTVLGVKGDAKSIATDTTAISAVSIWKQISASVQAIASSIAGTLTVATHAVTQSGTWTVQPGNTANTTAWKVDASSVAVPITDNAASLTVDNGGTFLTQENGAALTALQLIDDTITAQSTALGSTKTSLVGGSVTTAAPTYTTGQINPLSLDTTGALRVNVTAGGAGGGAVTNAGTFVVQESGAALTALQLIDDTVVAQGTALGTTKNSLTGASVTTSAPTYTTGQISPLSMDTSGALRVTGAGGGTQYTEDAAAATDPIGNMMVAVRRDTLSASEVSADGDNIAVKATSKGQIHVFAEITPAQVGPLATGTFTYATASGNLGLQPVALPSDQVWGVGATGFTKLEDAPSADGDKGVPSLAVRQDTPANTSGVDGDYEFLRMSAGRLWASTQAYGDVTHDAVDSGNPVKGGHKATTSLAGLTLVSNADRSDSFSGVDGVQIVRPHCNLEDIVSGILANTDGASTSVIAAQGAGVKTYITDVIIANSSATAVTVDLRDGAAGAVKATFPVPANTSGVMKSLQVPLPFSANTAVCMDGSAAASTVTCTLIGFKSKV